MIPVVAGFMVDSWIGSCLCKGELLAINTQGTESFGGCLLHILSMLVLGPLRKALPCL